MADPVARRPQESPTVQIGVGLFVSVAVVGFIWLVWSKPVLLLYLLLAIVGVMAYAAIYLLVSARMVDEESLEDGEPDDEPEEPEDERDS